MADHDLLSIRNVRVEIGGVQVLSIEGLAISSAPGVNAVIIGPNGAGKTTLLNAITGYVDVPNPGEIRFQNARTVQLNGHSPADIVRAGVSRTFQSPSLFKSLTVYEVLRVAATFSRYPRNGTVGHMGTISQILAAVDLAPELSTKNLTLPMARRLELARALATGPRLLLLDEPTAGLAAEDKEWLKQFIAVSIPNVVKLQHENGSSRFSEITIVLITHDMRFLEMLRAASLLLHAPVHFMDLGRLVLTGTLDTVLTNELVRGAYLGG